MHNSVRSQIAEGYLKARYSDLFDAASAGSDPGGVHPFAVTVMNEIGIDISGHRSKLVDEFNSLGIDIVVTVCDREHQACPFFLGVRETIRWFSGYLVKRRTIPDYPLPGGLRRYHLLD